MKNTYSSKFRALTWAIMLAAGSLVSCNGDDKGDNPPPVPPPPAPVELNNQIEYDGGKPVDINSAVYDVEDTDLYTFFLSPASGITDIAGMDTAEDCLRVAVRSPKGTVDTATDTFEICYKDISLNNRTINDAEKAVLSADLAAGTSQLDLCIEVVLKSGKTLRARYKSTCTEAVPQNLDNQYELDKNVSAIGSVVEWHSPAEGTTAYYFYSESGVEFPSAGRPAGMQIVFTDGMETANIDLSAADPEKVSVSCGGFSNTAGTTGTLGVATSGTELTVALDARNGDSRLRAAYTGPFARGYESSNRIKVTAAETPQEADLKRIFLYKESMMNTYAFGFADAETPDGLREGEYAVRFGLSDLSIGTTIDLAKEASKCTFALYDYRNYATYDIAETAGVTGTIASAGTAEKPYIRFSVAFPGGPTVEGEWFGDAATVTEPFELTPVRPFTPHLTIVSPEDETLEDKELSAMEMRLEKNYRLRGGDPQYGGAVFDAYFFYFRTENSDSPIETPEEFPRLMIPASYLNSTNLDLSVAREGLYWNFKFINRNLQQTEYSETYTMYGTTYGYCPDEAKATVVRNADKTWKVSFEMKDSYPSAWNPDRKEGSQNTVTVEWEGPATKYSGPNENDLTDADY